MSMANDQPGKTSRSGRIRRLYVTDYALSPQERIEKCGILCQNDRILAIGGITGFKFEPELEVYEIPDSYATPGFIDTHVHGAGNFDSSRSELGPAGLEAMSRTLAEHGVTSFVPTVVSAPPQQMCRNLAALAAMMEKEMPGADPVGIHIEGPFLNPVKRGAQQEECIASVDLGFARELLAAGGGKVRRMTFAPELANAEKLIELLCESDVLPSMGHSVANEAETLRAIDAGAHCCTHLFNGMPPLEQRRITLTGVALTDDRVTTEMILDGRHIDPRMVNLACRCKPAGNVVAISDATMGAGMPDGAYWIGDTPITIENGYSHTAAGTLAGTTTLLDTGWHGLMTYGKIDETLAAQSVSVNPARSLGLTDRGILRPPLRADLVIFEQGTNRVLLTIRRGEIVYRVPEIRPTRERQEEAL